tara:strand:- start:545 stop:709 length:165 start_codon:yes stop_codon:yes gene_type:complete
MDKLSAAERILELIDQCNYLYDQVRVLEHNCNMLERENSELDNRIHQLYDEQTV